MSVCGTISSCKSNLAGNAIISTIVFISSCFKRRQNTGILLFTVSLNQIFQILKYISQTHIHKPNGKGKSENKGQLIEVDSNVSLLISSTSICRMLLKS